MPGSASPPLVVLTHEFFPFRGGIAVYVEEAARAAAQLAPGTVTVFAPAHAALSKISWPFTVHQLPLCGSQSWRDRLVLARAIRSFAAELARATVWLPEPGALLAAMYLNALGRLPARRLVLTLHGSEILRFAARPHRRRLFQKLLDRADRVVVVSLFVRALLEKHFRVPAAKITVVPGALRSAFVDTRAARPPRPPGVPVVLLTVARVHPRKGQHAVLEALALLAKKLPLPVEYLIAGPVINAAYRRRLEALAKKSGAAVRFLGEVPDASLPALFAQADLFVLTPIPHGPSLEGFGLAYLEAAAHGLPSVAHRTGGVPEAVRDGLTGLLADPADRPALAAALEKLITDPALRTRLATAAHHRAHEYTWPDNARALFSGLG